MPRARYNHKLIRIPAKPEVAYALAYHYDITKDEELVRKNSDKLRDMLKPLMATFAVGRRLSPKQRLVVLQLEFPEDLRLKGIKAALEKEDNKFLARFRADPEAVYWEEEAAIKKALHDLECEAKILETVG